MLPHISADIRIQNELQELTEECSDEYTAGPNGDDIYNWSATILGPNNSPYEDGVYFLSITFPNEYPLRPPTVRFNTRIYHPNVTEQGNIRLPCLGINWSVIYTISKILVSIRALMSTPNMESVVEPEVAEVFRTNADEYKRIARQWTNLYAI